MVNGVAQGYPVGQIFFDVFMVLSQCSPALYCWLPVAASNPVSCIASSELAQDLSLLAMSPSSPAAAATAINIWHVPTLAGPLWQRSGRHCADDTSADNHVH